METVNEQQLDAPATRLAIDHELELVESAVAFVEAGGSRSVTVAGLRFGRQILSLPRWRELGDRIRLVPIWRFDGLGCDIAVTLDG